MVFYRGIRACTCLTDQSLTVVSSLELANTIALLAGQVTELTIYKWAGILAMSSPETRDQMHTWQSSDPQITRSPLWLSLALGGTIT